MDDERFELLSRVASLYYEEGKNQDEVAAIMGYSRSHISRMLAEAREAGIVEIRVNHPLERIAALEERLAGAFNLQDVRVLKGNGLPYAQMLRRLGGLAARLLKHKLKPDSILGISWGTALYEVGAMLQPIDLPGVKVVQIVGSATTLDHQVDGPGLARAFSMKIGGQYYTMPAPWLVGDKKIRDALMKERRMREVVELTRQVDIALVGIGAVDPMISSLVRAGCLNFNEAKEIQLMGAAGDVCGHYFDICGNLMEIPLAGYAFGIDTDTLRGIPLSIGVAGGQVKAPGILGALRSKLVNSLVTDDAAARKVFELFDVESC